MKKIDELIARSSIGAALADIKARGIDAHLVELERELRPQRRALSPREVPPKKPEGASKRQKDDAFMRGFGVALASIWRCQHDGQMVQQLIKENGFTLEAFRDIGLDDSDYEMLCRAARR